jgi:hypothetical protein
MLQLQQLAHLEKIKRALVWMMILYGVNCGMNQNKAKIFCVIIRGSQRIGDVNEFTTPFSG